MALPRDLLQLARSVAPAPAIGALLASTGSALMRGLAADWDPCRGFA